MSLQELAFTDCRLVGMAYQSISSEHESPYFATLFSEGVVRKGQFSFALLQSGAELYLGGADSSKYTGSIAFTPVTKQAYWQVNMNSAKVNGKTVTSNTPAIIDTGEWLKLDTADRRNDTHLCPDGERQDVLRQLSGCSHTGKLWLHQLAVQRILRRAVLRPELRVSP